VAVAARGAALLVVAFAAASFFPLAALAFGRCSTTTASAAVCMGATDPPGTLSAWVVGRSAAVSALFAALDVVAVAPASARVESRRSTAASDGRGGLNRRLDAAVTLEEALVLAVAAALLCRMPSVPP
jgi:hypothetical protein